MPACNLYRLVVTLLYRYYWVGRLRNVIFGNASKIFRAWTCWWNTNVKRTPHSPHVRWESFMRVHQRSCIGGREAASLLGQQKVLRAAWLGKTWGIPGCYCSTLCTETRAVTAAISVSSVQHTMCPMCRNPGCSCISFCQIVHFSK